MGNYYDYAWARPGAATLVRAGAQGVLRYISRDPSKDLLEAERDDMLAHGLDIGLVYEYGTGDALNGAGQGALDGAWSRQRMDRLGCPPHMAAYWAVDQNISPTHWPALDAYGRAFRAMLGGRPSGVYAESDYIDHALDTGVAQFGWYPGAASWSNWRVTDRAHFLQQVGEPPVPSTDLNYTQVLPGGTWFNPGGEDIVALSDEEIQAIADRVWSKPIRLEDGQGGHDESAASLMSGARYFAREQPGLTANGQGISGAGDIGRMWNGADGVPGYGPRAKEQLIQTLGELGLLPGKPPTDAASAERIAQLEKQLAGVTQALRELVASVEGAAQ